MKFNLIICTYKRPKAIAKLLESVATQSRIPDEVLVIDASPDDFTRNLLKNKKFPGLKYFKVEDKDRGLTRQRNYGIQKTREDIEIICFLDDDIILEINYFEKLIHTYSEYPEALGVGGYITNEVSWEESDRAPTFVEFNMDGFIRNLGSRNVLRKKLGLLSNKPPGFMPEFSHGYSTGFLPPSGKVYPVEFFMGGVSSYKKDLLERIEFSAFFEGYGLYEDMDFCLRAAGIGKLYVNTSACCLHFHDESGRPDQERYGKMVVRNGHYVWKLKYPNPPIVAILKWNLIIFTLLLIRFKNYILDGELGAGKDALGRLKTWILLPFISKNLKKSIS
jgi:GT2 family glycosyltransferase